MWLSVIFVNKYVDVYDDDVVVLLAEGDRNCPKSSKVTSIKSESRDTEESACDSVEDLSKVHFAAVANEELHKLIIPDNERVNSANSRRVNSPDCCQSDEHLRPAKLPEFEHFLTDLRPPSTRTITELGDCCDSADADQLETERADFGDVPARFQQNVTWHSASETVSPLTLSDGKNQRSNKSSRNWTSDSRDDNSTETTDTHNSVSDRDATVNSCSDVTVNQLIVPASTAERLNSRLNGTSSDLSLQVSRLSDQLAAQVINRCCIGD